MKRQSQHTKITVTEYAQRIGKSVETIRRWIRDGKLQADLDGGQYYILDESLTPQNDSLITVIEAKDQLIESLRLENERLTLQLQVKDEQIKNLQDEFAMLRQDAEEARRRADILIAQLQEYLTRPWWRRVWWRKQLSVGIKMQGDEN